jgi:hypothetical protein
MFLRIKNKSLLISLINLFVLFVIFKIYRFELLAYTIDDLFNNLEATYSWLVGRPITYANGLGKSNYTHNYFLTPALGFITYFFGAYGIFIFYLFLILIVWLYFFGIFDPNLPKNIVLFGSLFLSPTMLWIIDDPGVGWTIELLFLPFTILFAMALRKGQVFWAIFWAIATILVREDGIILCCFVQLCYILFGAKNRDSFWRKLFSKKLIIWGVFWLSLFIISMTFLQMTAPNDTFFEGALATIKNNYLLPDFQSKNLILGLKALLMLSPIFLLLYYLIGNDFYKLGVFVFIIFAFIFINLLQGARYFNQFFFENVSITWVPRFVLPFSFSLAFMLLVVENKNTKPLNIKYLTICIVLFLIQFPIISFCRKDVSYTSIVKSLLHNKPEHRMQHLLNPADLKLIKLIEKTIPRRSTVFVQDYIMPIFVGHFQTWPSRDFEYEKADLAIIPTTGFTHLQNQLMYDMKPNYKKIAVLGPYDIIASEKYKNILLQNTQLKLLVDNFNKPK